MAGDLDQAASERGAGSLAAGWDPADCAERIVLDHHLDHQGPQVQAGLHEVLAGIRGQAVETNQEVGDLRIRSLEVLQALQETRVAHLEAQSEGYSDEEGIRRRERSYLGAEGHAIAGFRPVEVVAAAVVVDAEDEQTMPQSALTFRYVARNSLCVW